jgi:threonine 3-dehydrogenase
MSTLITGGTGFIGAEIVRLLLEKGEKDLFVFDINPSTKLLDEVADQVEVVRGDLGNFSHVMNIVKTCKPQVIYHLGGMLSVPSDADHAASFRANAMGTFHILEASKLFAVPQVLFSSTLATFALDIQEDVISDYTIQRPQLFYGATKVFCELMGMFYKRKFGLDFRSVRYPSIVGPGVKTPGVVQYTSWVIEECAKGNPYTMYVKPETKCPVMYFKDGAKSIVKLGEAPVEDIKMVNYLIDGATPTASAQELVDIVRKKIPGAQISFDPDLDLQKMLDKFLLPLDDSIAKKEWNWTPEYDQEQIVDDFLEEMKQHPERYV